MAQYFAQIDQNQIVQQVIVADQDFVNSLPGLWVETDINGVSPKNYAGIGYSWDPVRNAFIPPKQFASWILDEASCHYIAPIAYPTDGQNYSWDEVTVSWVLIA